MKVNCKHLFMKTVSVKITVLLCFFSLSFRAQNKVYWDTIPVFEAGNRLLSPWAGGLNFCAFSQIDLNFDGKNDIAIFDKISGSGGKLRSFINIGSPGVAKYKHEPKYQNQFPVVQEWVLFFDYNKDGKADLFTYTTGGIKVYKNTGTASSLSFTLAKSLLTSNYNPSGSPSIANIYCNPVGLPGITDIDGDGDLDILTYSVFGIKMEYHKNMSKERYGHADSLVYDMVDDCWGDIQESTCTVYLSQCPYPKMYHDIVDGGVKKVLHAGSCIMCFDRDGDADKDLILGDVSCTDVSYVENGGSSTNAHITDTTKMYPNYPNKASTTTIKMNSFPCTYYLDVDNDGFGDLIASPNSVAGAENYQSVWYYKNTSTTPTVNFSLQKKNLLQEDMIEVGEGSYPVLFDADADGKKDLIIGNLGYYTGNINVSKLAYYKNIGTTTAPSFSLITRDYQGLSAYGIYAMAPTFGDLDNDGDQDLIIGAYDGTLHYFENSAGASNPAVFTTHVGSYKTIDVGNFAFPQIVDVDKNGTLDLLIGSQNGRLAFYSNNGTLTVPSFTLLSASFGGVNVKQAGYVTGYSYPFLFNQAGVSKLLVGSEIGNIYLYDNIDGNLAGAFNRVDTNLYKINEGTRCAPFYEDITGDGLRDLFLGNHAGGVAFFNSTNVNLVNVKEQEFTKQVVVYPNPAKDKLFIAIDDGTYAEAQIKIHDILGKEMLAKNSFNKKIEIDISLFSAGIYFVTVESLQDNLPKKTTKKIIIE